jgi:transposase
LKAHLFRQGLALLEEYTGIWRKTRHSAWFGMVRRKLTISERWQAVGMHNGGFSHRRVANHFRVNHSIIVRLMQRFRQTGNVTDRSRAGRPRKTTPREDRLISRRARQRPFSTAGALRGNFSFGGHISTRTVIRRLHHQGMRARRPIKRPQLTLRHRHARLDWSHDHSCHLSDMVNFRRTIPNQ